MKLLFPLSVFLILAGAISANFVSASERIDINTAPLEDLMKIIHIGEVRAVELISLRPFSSLDELTKIKGVGEARLKDIKKQGLAWVADENIKPAEDGPPPAPPASPAEVLPRRDESEPPQILLEGGLPILPKLPENTSPAPPLLAAIFTSLSSGVIILLLKKHVRT